MDGKILGWIKAWLSDRRQRVVINGCNSEWGQVIRGVPQGSVLRPLLFSIYIDDLDNGTSSDISTVVDDTKIDIIIRPDYDGIVLWADLDGINEWRNGWQLQFNINKCKYSVSIKEIHSKDT